jgi:hypothetical protein
MNIMRRLAFGLVTISVTSIALSSGALAYYTGIIDQRDRPAEPAFGFEIQDEDNSYAGSFSSIYNGTIGCSSIEDQNCAKTSNLSVTLILPPCSVNALPTDVCIKSLRTGDSSGVLQPAILQYEANTNKFPKDEKHLVSAGGSVSVWRGASLNSGALDYSVAVTLRMIIPSDSQGFYGKKIITGYSAQVIPIKIKTGNYYPIYWKSHGAAGSSPEPQLPAGVTSYDPWVLECIFTDLGRCAIPDTFDAGQRIELSIQMDNDVTGWIFGRMKDTKASAVPLAKNTTLLTIEGTSINVPSGLSWVPLSEIKNSPALQELDWNQYVSGNKNLSAASNPNAVLVRNSNHSDLFQFPPVAIPPEKGGGVHNPDPSLNGTGMLQAIEPWLKTEKVVPTWRFQGMNPKSFWGIDQTIANRVWSCTVNDKTKIHGVMTTNAMAYSWSPPALIDGFLTYKVAGAHTDIDGSVYKGSYDLSMNLDSAKCIYGFTDAPIMASISVTSSGGASQDIATESVTKQNGWMSLSAKNFTFSSPTIKIKLTQEKLKEVAPSPSASAIPVTKKVAVKTLTCVKGKTIKTIKGVNPKCPTGYKAK